MQAVKERVYFYAYVWVALAKLQHDNPGRESFTNSEIEAQVRLLWPDLEIRPIFRQLLYVHMVAGRKPNDMPRRLIHKLSDGSNRLYRPGDPFHPDRKNESTVPDAVPPGYEYLIGWYESGYRNGASVPAGTGSEPPDRILSLWKRGQNVWVELGGADAFVDEQRSGWESADRG